MKNRLVTISFREIKKSFKRFLSLIIMSFLGVGVFVGLRNTPGTMLKSLDKYYDETSHYDLKVVSTLGLTQNDINSLNKLGMPSYGIHTKDVITNFKKDTRVIKIIGINENIDKLLLIKGNLPQNENEIAVEHNIILKEGLKLGDYINIAEDESLKNHKFKIVGIVSSPLYLFVGGNSITRGSTNIGSGKIEYYSYVKDDVFDMEYYPEVDILISNNYMTSFDKYIDLMNDNIDKVESIKKQREKARYEEIIEKYNIEINQKEEEGKKELEKANKQLKNAKKKLANGYSKLVSTKKQLNDSKAQLDQTLNTLNNSKKELEINEKKLIDGKKELASAEKELTEVLEPYGLEIDDILTIKDILNDQVVSKERLKHIFQNSEYREQIEELIDNLYENDFFINLKNYIETETEEAKTNLIASIPKDIENYEEIVHEIESFNKDTVKENIYEKIIDSAYNIDDIKSQIPSYIPYRDRIINFLDNYANSIIKIRELFTAVDKITYGQKELVKSEVLLLEGKEELEKGYQTYSNYLNQYNDGLNKYNSGYKEYKNSQSIYDSNLEKYLKNKFDFENEIEKAREKLKDIDTPKWYIFDRSADSEYSGYINNTDSIKNLSGTFPTVFFLVAIFMCIMCMSRMALEDRSEIGTLKSLGFSNRHIILKYVIYSTLATLIGSILGGLFGFYFLTWFISKMYGILYSIPYFEYQYNIAPFIIGTLIATICITGTAVLTVKKIVDEKPSSLLRPLTPNKGKKMLIENIPLWNKIKFSNKITVRNIVRYKKRVIMTILGIAGCTVLLLAGYGIRDSIMPVAEKQFKEVFRYDDAIYLDHESDDISFITNDKSVKNYEKSFMQTVKVDDLSADLLAVDGDNLNYDVINITDYKTHKRLYIEKNKVIISEKLAKIYNYNIGDKISFVDANNKKYQFEISGISTNYFSFYIYMNIKTYENYFEEYKPNIVFVNLKDADKEEAVAKELMKNEHVLSIVTKEVSLKNVETMLQSLNYVVIILIVLSGMLSFVVLYNLSYINISERKREIATLKVLGFTHREVDNYIIKENFIITIIGIIIGLVLAKPFVDYIINTVEIDLVKFIHIINALSYVYAFIFMTIFTLIVTVIIHFTLKKINMIESLKTVE